MKRILMIMICAALAVSLCACGRDAAPTETPAPTESVDLAPVDPTPSGDEAEAASATEAEELAEEVPASSTDADAAAPDAEAYAAAQACVGLTLEELYAAVGEPSRTSYAASCLEENAEDGMLFYEDLGFYVWTVRSESGELVHAVYSLYDDPAAEQ